MQHWRNELPLVYTKLFVPAPQRALVPRQRLLQLLERPSGSLSVVLAGAGWGKSTLLAQWAALHPQRVAWLALDAGDNEPLRFLSYLVAAFQTLDPHLGSSALSTLQTPQPADPEVILIRLLNELAAWSGGSSAQPWTLILDDFNLLESPEVLSLVTFLVEHMPTTLRLVLASRSEPPLPLGRWRVHGLLHEIRTVDLRFTAEEAALFFRHSLPLNVPPATLETLNQRTEGWVAGLHLAGLAAQGQTDLAAFVADFSGSHRYLLDYVAGDVLAQQPEQVQAFVYATAILERICAPLAAALLEDSVSAAAQLLAYVSRQQLFLVALDTEAFWYRYHHLFAELLRHQLRQTAPQRIPQLHQRASRWYAEQGLLEDALLHSLAADDLSTAIGLIVQHGRSLLMRGAATTVQSWLRHLPRHLILGHAHLALIQAWVDLVLIRPGDIELCLQAAEQQVAMLPAAEQRRLHDEITAIRAIVPRFTDAIPLSMQRSQAALHSIDPSDTALQGIVAGNLTVVQTLLGQLSAASESAALAVRANQASGNTFAALLSIYDQGVLQSLAGRLFAAAETFQQGLRLAEHQGWQHDPAYGSLQIGLAHVFYQWSDLQQASLYAQQGVAVAQTAGYLDIVADGLLVQAQILVAQAQFDQAAAVLDQALLTAERNHVDRFIYRMRAYQAKLALHQNRLHKARQLLPQLPSSRDGLDPEYAAEYLVHLAVAVALHDWAAAEAYVAQLQAVVGERVAARIELTLLHALMDWGRARQAAALKLVEAALHLARAGGYIRIFLDLCPPLLPLLQAVQPSAQQAYVQRVLSFVPVRVPLPLHEPLSEREKEVLRWVEAGYTNQAIAAELVLSVGTVKRHLSNIYGKLAVGNRTEAVARARERGFLS